MTRNIVAHKCVTKFLFFGRDVTVWAEGAPTTRRRLAKNSSASIEASPCIDRLASPIEKILTFEIEGAVSGNDEKFGFRTS